MLTDNIFLKIIEKKIPAKMAPMQKTVSTMLTGTMMPALTTSSI